jgi:endonuclease/exonuclease/phosphatase (EEP) superfamily protein YafD
VVVLVVLELFVFVGERSWAVMLLLYVPRALFLLPAVAIGLLLLRTGQRRLLWTQAICAMLVLWPLMGLHIALPRRERGVSLRLLTYNVWAGALGAEAIRREVLEARPDVVLFQATTQAADDAFRGPAFRGWAVRRAGPYSIATRYRIDEVEVPTEAPSSNGPPFVRFLVETPLGPIDVFSIHPQSLRGTFSALPPGCSWRRTLRDGCAVLALRKNRAQRERQVRAVAEAAARSQNLVVIAGDINLPGMSRLQERELGRYQDGFLEAGTGFGYTFPANGFAAWLRLDRILAGPGLRFAAFGVGGDGGSDHRPVWADVQREP